MQRATLRDGSEEYPVDLEDLRDDVRLGQLRGDVLLRYPPWTGERFVALATLPQLHDELGAPGALLAARLSRFGVPWVSVAVTLLITLAGVLQFTGRMPDLVYDPDSIHRYAIGYEALLFERAIWAPITSQLVHGSVAHVAGNLVAIAISGWRVERALGSAAYLVVAAASVVLGAAVVVAVSPLPVIGSSTLGFGLLAAHITLGFRLGDALPPSARGKYGFGVLPVFLFLLLPTLTLPAVAHSAHLGGLLGGGFAAMAVPMDAAARPAARTRLRLLNLGLAALLLAAPAALTPLLASHPALVLGRGAVTEVEGTGVKLRLPWRIARNEGVLLGAKAWSTSPGSKEVLFGGLNRARELLDPVELGRTWERGAELVLLDEPEPLGPGWLATAFHRIEGEETSLIVEHQQLRGTTLVRLGYMADLDADGRPGPRARLFESILRTAELGDPPLLAQARRKFGDFPEVASYREEFGRQLYLIGAWTEAEQVLAPLIDPSQLRGSDALRMRLDLWANHPAAVRAAYPPELIDPSWLEVVLEASTSQRYYQDRGIRALIAFRLCLEAESALARYRENRPDAPELPELDGLLGACGE